MLSSPLASCPAPSPRASFDVIALREWGTDRSHPLGPRRHHLLLGTSSDCTIQLSDPTLYAVHAYLVRAPRQWHIRGLGATAEIRQDGVRADLFSLQSGMEVGVGATTLIAESEHWISLGRFCERLVGWSPERRAAVDGALRSLRRSLTYRAPLVLCGVGDLVPVAQALHRHTLGAERPFVVCDTRRTTTEESVRSPANCEILDDAMHAAAGGTLCVRSVRLPVGFPAALEAARQAKAPIQIVVCAPATDGSPFGATPIWIPSPRDRGEEQVRLLEAYEQEAIDTLGSPLARLPDDDRAWILTHATASLPDLEKATLRLVAVRSSPHLAHAADRLGMARVSLRRWLGRRFPRTGADGGDAPVAS